MHRLLRLAIAIVVVLVLIGLTVPVAQAMSPPSAATQVNVSLCAPSAGTNYTFDGIDAVASYPVVDLAEVTTGAYLTANNIDDNVLFGRAAPANEQTEGQSASAIGATTTLDWRRSPWV